MCIVYVCVLCAMKVSRVRAHDAQFEWNGRREEQKKNNYIRQRRQKLTKNRNLACDRAPGPKIKINEMKNNKHMCRSFETCEIEEM